MTSPYLLLLMPIIMFFIFLVGGYWVQFCDKIRGPLGFSLTVTGSLVLGGVLMWVIAFSIHICLSN